MTHRRYWGLVLVPLLTVGCGVKQVDHDEVLAELEECKAESLRWESLYQESVEERRLALDQALEMLPAAHEELRSQIDLRLSEVTQTLDETMKTEVQESVYALAEAIASGYNVMQQENQQLQGQLAEARNLIETVLERTDTIAQAAGSIEQQVGSEKEAFLAARQAILLEIGDVEAFLRDWNYMHIECKGCEERLRINSRERDALASLHDDLISKLEAVRQRLTAAGYESPPDADPTETDPTEADPTEADPTDADPIDADPTEAE